MIKDLLNFEGPVNAIFIIKSCIKGVTSSGSDYYSLTLQDSSGVIDAKIFNDANQYSPSDLVSGAIVKIEGVVGTYRGHAQIKINDLEIIDESKVDLSSLIPTAPIAKADLLKKLDDYISMIKDKELKTLTKTVLDENMDAYSSFPAATAIHHAYYSGLLYHSLSICENAISISKYYSFLNLDYLICGSLLHDIGKIKEFSSPTSANYTTEGNLLGHINIGYAIVNSCGEKLKMTSEKLNNVLHIILSHHGQPEFGSSKVPQTAEAFVIHYLDDLDAKLNIFETQLFSIQEGGFSQKIFALDNISIYKPLKFEEEK